MLHRLCLAGLVLACLAVPAAAETCAASFYGAAHHGRKTASGQRFDMNALTAAHRSYRFGTRLRVTYQGRAVVVTVTDRGPAKWTGRCLDLSAGAARVLGMTKAGVGRVTIEKLR